MVRAKFTVQSKTETVVGFSISMLPVTSGSEENEAFFKYTPSGKLELATINPAAASQLEVGKSYYLDFSPAD